MNPTSALHGSVAVWVLPLDRDPPDEPLLGPDDLADVARLRRAADRARQRRARGWRRLVLASYLERPAASLKFARSPEGRPSLADDRLVFSASASADVGLLAVGTVAVGADVERRRALPDLEGMAGLACTDEERRRVCHAPDPSMAFLEIWTAKEALGKALGMGLDTVLLTGTTVAEDGTFTGGAAPRAWSWSGVTVEPGYVAAVVAPRTHLPATVCQIADLADAAGAAGAEANR